MKAYEYGPFGEPIRVSGLAGLNPFRFSTKYTDDETGLVYYGYRYYSPGLGRWINRDSIKENGGVNIYSFLKAPVNSIDRLGLESFECCNTETISKGLDKLNEKYTRLYNDFERSGIPHWGVGAYSCANVNGAILGKLAPIPMCWKCTIEHREDGKR